MVYRLNLRQGPLWQLNETMKEGARRIANILAMNNAKYEKQCSSKCNIRFELGAVKFM